jgi:hypothetical protein
MSQFLYLLEIKGWECSQVNHKLEKRKIGETHTFKRHKNYSVLAQDSLHEMIIFYSKKYMQTFFLHPSPSPPPPIECQRHGRLERANLSSSLKAKLPSLEL